MSVREYICRRCIRLYPMFILGILVGSCVLYILMKAGLADYSIRDVFESATYNGLFLPYFAHKGIQSLGDPSRVFGEVFPTDPPAWSLFFELFASVIFVALLNLKKRTLIRTIILSYVVLLFGSAQLAFVEYRHDLDIGLGWGTTNFVLGFPRVLFGFTYGVFLYRFADGNWIKVRNFFGKYTRSPWLLYFALIVILLAPITLDGLYSALILAIIAPAVVFVGAAVDCNSAFDAAVSKFLGWVSYPIYCLHFPIGRLVFLLAVSGGRYSSVEAASISVASTIVASIILTKFYEEPTRAYLTLRLLSQPHSIAVHKQSQGRPS